MKRHNTFLYLTLACFLGLIAIFIADGYMGVYDTIYVTTTGQDSGGYPGGGGTDNLRRHVAAPAHEQSIVDWHYIDWALRHL